MPTSPLSNFVLAGTLLALAGTAQAQGLPEDAEPMEPSGAAQLLLSEDMDEFFETAASSNRFEIEASRMALDKAQSPQVKEFAQMMVEDHGKAGDKLKALAAQKNVTLPDELLWRHRIMLDDLRDEEAEDFDEEYLDKMQMTHLEAVSLFDEVASQSEVPEVQSLAAELLPTLQRHGGMADALEDRLED